MFKCWPINLCENYSFKAQRMVPKMFVNECVEMLSAGDIRC